MASVPGLRPVAAPLPPALTRLRGLQSQRHGHRLALGTQVPFSPRCVQQDWPGLAILATGLALPYEFRVRDSDVQTVMNGATSVVLAAGSRCVMRHLGVTSRHHGMAHDPAVLSGYCKFISQTGLPCPSRTTCSWLRLSATASGLNLACHLPSRTHTGALVLLCQPPRTGLRHWRSGHPGGQRTVWPPGLTGRKGPERGNASETCPLAALPACLPSGNARNLQVRGPRPGCLRRGTRALWPHQGCVLPVGWPCSGRRVGP